MYLIEPIPISPNDLIGVPAGSFPTWSEVATYEARDQVKTLDGRVWEATLTSYTVPGQPKERNLGRDPANQTGFLLPYDTVFEPRAYLHPDVTTPHFWWAGVEEDEASDAFIALSTPISRATTVATLTLFPRYRFDTVVLFGLDCPVVTVEVGGQVIDRSLVISDPIDPLRPYRSKTCIPLGFTYEPGVEGSTGVTITVNGPCGYIMLGIAQRIGLSLIGTQLSIKDYSRKDRDTFGNITVIEREYSDAVSFQVDIPTDKAAQVRRLLAQYRSTPAAYTISFENDDFLVFGFYADFAIPIQAFNYSTMNTEIEGLV